MRELDNLRDRRLCKSLRISEIDARGRVRRSLRYALVGELDDLGDRRPCESLTISEISARVRA